MPDITDLARRFALRLAVSSLVPRKVRWLMLRVAGLDINTTAIAPGCKFFGSGVSIARGCYINTGCLFDNTAPIRLERGVHFGQWVFVITSTHEIGDHGCRAGKIKGAAVHVGEGAWIGTRVTILPGVSIGAGAIVAAGSVVTSNVEPDCVYGGVPAKRIRTLTEPVEA